MANEIYNPDVLNCIANLSNDEVFTPPELANKMLDLLPQELFRSSETTFLDPFTKSGVFLREIVKRLDRGLEKQIPGRQQRIDHILHHQVFGIACTELTSLLARRSVYCSKFANGKYSISKFDTEEGNILYRNIQHTWVNGKCKYCGASQSVYDRGSEAEQYAYMFIHTDNPSKFFNNMKFDVIIGNPPYQMSDGGGMQTESSSGSAIPLYHLFVNQSKKLNAKYISMIIPARWYSGGRGLDAFRDEMLNDGCLSHIVDYADSRDCFPGVDIAGGVCYFLRNLNNEKECTIENHYKSNVKTSIRKLNEYSVFIRFSQAIDIIKKVLALKEQTMEEWVYSSKPFGFRSFEFGNDKRKSGDVEMLGSKGFSYVSKKDVRSNLELIEKWKVVMSKASAEHAGQTDNDGRKKVVSKVEVLKPNQICTETYLLLGTFDEENEANNLAGYVKTSFFRFLLSTILLTQNIAKDKFQFVPLQDFSHPWTDEMLYKKYGLTQEEIAFIESMIRPME
ncbi:MAG: Eco57I restriction-modification methylase domain-containing protein [Prevotella sp.]|nr:Eco57I restriction-modification methylase domain-containing protein [Prevotella sp.]